MIHKINELFLVSWPRVWGTELLFCPPLICRAASGPLSTYTGKVLIYKSCSCLSILVQPTIQYLFLSNFDQKNTLFMEDGRSLTTFYYCLVYRETHFQNYHMFFNKSKCATNYVISFEIYDGFIGQKILKLWRHESWPFSPKSSPNLNSCSIKISHRLLYNNFDPMQLTIGFKKRKKAFWEEHVLAMTNVRLCPIATLTQVKNMQITIWKLIYPGIY